MRYLYSTFLRPRQSRKATEWHVLTGSHSFYLPPTRPSWLYSVSHSPDGTTRTRQNTSDIAYYSIYRPRKDERISLPSWLTYSGRLTHIIGHPSAAGRAWDRESSPVKDQRSTAVPRNHNQKELVRVLSNGAISSDLERPIIAKATHICIFLTDGEWR